MALAVSVCVSGTEPRPQHYICHPNAMTTTHVCRSILCIQHTHLHDKAFAAGVCVSASNTSMQLCFQMCVCVRLQLLRMYMHAGAGADACEWMKFD